MKNQGKENLYKLIVVVIIGLMLYFGVILPFMNWLGSQLGGIFG